MPSDRSRRTSQASRKSGKSSPSDPELYAEVKREAALRFNKPSAYRSGWIVKTYKERGGLYEGDGRARGGLWRWFREKWVDLTRPQPGGGYAPCGRPSSRSDAQSYPTCRPTVRVSDETPLTVQELSSRSIRAAKHEKRSDPNARVFFGRSV
jgi:hypothetical protein